MTVKACAGFGVLAGRPPTKRQRDVLSCVVAHVRYYGLPPTHEEIGLELGIGLSTVAEHLNGLEERGLIRRPARYAGRGIEIMHDGHNPLRCADCGASV